MCNIVDIKCACCNRVLDMHLEDYDTQPEEINVFCRKHIPKDISRGALWEIDKSTWPNKKLPYKANELVFVEWLTDNAQSHYLGNCPNWDCHLISGGVAPRQGK